MKRLFGLLMLLIFMTVFVSGCGKPSAKEYYDVINKMPYATSFDDIVDKLGKEYSSRYNFFNKVTGKIISGEFTWKIEGIDDASVTISVGNSGCKEFKGKDSKYAGLCSVKFSKSYLYEIAKDKKLIVDGVFAEDIQTRVNNAIYDDPLTSKDTPMTYDDLRDTLKCEGIVYEKESGGMISKRKTTYIWFDKEGNNVTAAFEEKNRSTYM